jgi:hypothetical protein
LRRIFTGSYSLPPSLVAIRSFSLAPEALQERGCSCKVFYTGSAGMRVLVSAGIGNIPAGLGGVARTYLASSAFGAPQEV